MSLEGPPPPERKETTPISDEECLAAMKEGSFERVGAWYDEQEKMVLLDPSPHGHLQLTLRLARLQFESGMKDPDTGESYAFETLMHARMDADGQRNDDAVRQIDAIIEEMRAGA